MKKYIFFLIGLIIFLFSPPRVHAEFVVPSKMPSFAQTPIFYVVCEKYETIRIETQAKKMRVICDYHLPVLKKEVIHIFGQNERMKSAKISEKYLRHNYIILSQKDFIDIIAFFNQKHTLRDSKRSVKI
jgi:hypothetical protein